MFRTPTILLAAVIAMAASTTLFAQNQAKPKPAAIVATDAAHAGPDFQFQGEYAGALKVQDQTMKVGVQVVALGNGNFRAVDFHGGLPGDGWNGKDRNELKGQIKDNVATFDVNQSASVTIRDGVLMVKSSDGKVFGKLTKVVRQSPTLGAKSPAGAIVLFDGKSAEAFVDGRVKDGVLLEGTTSKRKFQSYKIHLEFMLPFMPEARGQGRGNSGYYAQGRYETQILDSFGLVPQKDDCGAIYGIQAPRINMCYPPLSWQTYDIDFTAAEYKDGKKVKNARLTVLHNGVEVQKDVEAPHATTAAPLREGPGPGPVYLQNHGNPVRFRNIWVVEKK
jgi:hypothetical protein